MAKKFKMDDDPFEGVLPHLKDSRKKKDDDVNSDNVSESDSAKNNAKDKDKNNYRNITRNIVSNNDDNNIKDNVNVVNNDVATDNVNDVNVANVSSNANDTDVNNVNDVSAAVSNFINISKKHKKTDGYIRISTYLLPDQVKAIEYLQKKTGRDKGELYRMAVNILIERARVE